MSLGGKRPPLLVEGGSKGLVVMPEKQCCRAARDLVSIGGG